MRGNEALRSVELSPGIDRQVETLGAATSFWMQDPSNAHDSSRVRDDVHQPVEQLNGTDFQWAPAIIHNMKEYKKSWLKLLNADDSRVVFGPRGTKWLPLEEKFRKGFLIWLTQAGMDFDATAIERWGSLEYMQKLG